MGRKYAYFGGNGSRGYTKPVTPATPFIPHTFAPRVQMLYPPRVFFTREAYGDMFTLVDLVEGEIGWIGSVKRLAGDYYDFLVEEIFLPAQTAHHATCELTEEGLAKWASEIMRERPDGLGLANSIRFWGHSHHTMGTSPSGQDETELMQRAKDCGDFFIRAILNKQGRLEVTVYLYEDSILVRDAEWALYEPQNASRRDRWVTEIQEKVKVHSSPTKGALAQALAKQLATVQAENDEGDFPALPVHAGAYHNEGDNNGWDGVKRIHTLAGTEVGEEAGPENLWRGKAPMGARKGGLGGH